MNAILKMIPPLRKLREKLRNRFFKFLRHVSDIDDTRDIFAEILADFNVGNAAIPVKCGQTIKPPYEDLGIPAPIKDTRFRDDVIFITGRFRSGSTVLWNLFRNIPGVTAYYEPFNERRWYDFRARGNRVDHTHLNVNEYWAEYEGLEHLSAYFQENWTKRRLYMDSRSWNLAMQLYIEGLIEKAAGRPVLQFNRIDFRLPWIRSRFPNSRIVHIYRHPRDQWCSSLRGTSVFKPHSKLRDFPPFDKFYLLMWANDLKYYFPFLTLDKNAHPYGLFYQLWKLSYLFGRKYADISIRFEDLVKEPAATIQHILTSLSFQDIDSNNLASVVKEVPIGKWRQYADAEWFGRQESIIDNFFAYHFGPESS
jgi:hypothetical protein